MVFLGVKGHFLTYVSHHITDCRLNFQPLEIKYDHLLLGLEHQDTASNSISAEKKMIVRDEDMVERRIMYYKCLKIGVLLDAF